MPRDVGSYFEQLTRRAPGGRRTDRDDRPDDGSEGCDGRSWRDRLKDLVGTGRDAARRTAEQVRSRSRDRRGPTLPRESVVTVEYSPDMDDGDPDPGEVVWAWVPFEEDPSQGKDRPVVVIGRRGARLVGIPLTSQRDDREAQVAIGTGGWDSRRRDSYARIWRMLEIDPGGMRREGAVLDRRRFDEVVAAVDRYYEVRR